MAAWPALSLAALLLVAAVGACGEVPRGAKSGTRIASTALATKGKPVGAPLGARRSTGHFRGDEDDDDALAKENEENEVDSDGDTDVDAKDNAGLGYHDGDDAPFVHFGHIASASDRHTITVLVGRYYAAAEAENGRRACALTYSILAESLPQDYGEAPGPSYLRGDMTCDMVLSGLFKHLHSGLRMRPKVTGVRVERNKALAMLGSLDAPASVIEARREHGVWKVDQVLDTPLR